MLGTPVTIDSPQVCFITEVSNEEMGMHCLWQHS